MRASGRPAGTYDLFLSHATKDIDRIRPFVAALEAAGLAVFFAPDDIIAGDRWDDVIRRAQSRSAATAVCITDETDDAMYARAEIHHAIALERAGHHRVIPVYLDGFRPGRAPFGLDNAHHLDLARTSVRDAAQKIARAVSRSPVGGDGHGLDPGGDELAAGDESVDRALRALRLGPEHARWLLALAGLEASDGWPVGVDTARATGRGPLLAFLVHTFLGDDAPAPVRRSARLIEWDGISQGALERLVARSHPRPLRSLADLRPSPSTSKVAERLGLVVWRTTESLSESLAARVYSDMDELVRGGIAELPGEEITIEIGGQRLDGAQAVDAARGRSAEHRALRAAAAVAWLEPRLDALPDAMAWLCEGLGRDPFRVDVLRRLDLERVRRTALPWARDRLADASSATLVALVDLRSVLGDDGGLLQAWAAAHAAPLRTWTDELFARTPDDVAGNSAEAGRARRRVLERMEDDARTRWIAAHWGAPTIAALPGPAPDDVTPLWLALLSPDATPEQRAVVRAHAQAGNHHAQAALTRIAGVR